jgi:hypothetical protein
MSIASTERVLVFDLLVKCKKALYSCFMISIATNTKLLYITQILNIRIERRAIQR